MTKPTISFHTLGCRVNQYEEQHLREAFEAQGFEILPFGEQSDYCVINTCAVTSESEHKSRNMISRAKKLCRAVIVTGCYGELINKNMVRRPDVFYVGGCKQKNLIPKIVAGQHTKPYAFSTEYQECAIGFGSHEQRCRAYIKIQDGCNGRCSYCLIPLMRGPSCSRPIADVVAEARRLADKGICEVILTGIETSDFGNLHELVLKIAEIDGISRIRLGSLNINCISDEFLATVAGCDKFCRHMHLSVQSACDRILRLMRRPYNKSRLVSTVERIYSHMPNILLSADIISSFPTESQEEFDETADFLQKYNFSHIHAFPYSPRPNTPAAAMVELLDASQKKQRNLRLVALSEQNKKRIFKDKLNKIAYILVEKSQNNACFGHSDDFLYCEVRDCTAAVGSIVAARVVGYDAKKLICEVYNND